MSLINNMILIITVVFSNNDIIIFEITESIFSSRILMIDEHDEHIDETQILRKNDSLMYTFDSNVEGFRTSQMFHINSVNNNVNSHVLPYAEEIEISGCTILKVEKNLLKASRIRSYYLKSVEISELVSKSEFISKIIDNKSDLLFLYADFTSTDSFTKKISSINIEWSSTHSEQLRDKLKMIE